MNPAKQHKKLERLQLKAEECTTREEAPKIIKKADKVHRKLTEGDHSQASACLYLVGVFLLEVGQAGHSLFCLSPAAEAAEPLASQTFPSNGPVQGLGVTASVTAFGESAT